MESIKRKRIKRRCGCVVYPVKFKIHGRIRKRFRYALMCKHHKAVNAGMVGFIFGFLAHMFIDYSRNID